MPVLVKLESVCCFISTITGETFDVNLDGTPNIGTAGHNIALADIPAEWFYMLDDDDLKTVIIIEKNLNIKTNRKEN